MTDGDHLSAQVVALHFMVQALISSHPDRAGLREVVDQLFGQFQANALASGAFSPEALAVARAAIEVAFSPPPASQTT